MGARRNAGPAGGDLPAAGTAAGRVLMSKDMVHWQGL